MKKLITLFKNLFTKPEPKQEEDVKVMLGVDFNIVNPTPKVVEEQKTLLEDQILTPLPTKKRTRKKKSEI